MPPAPRLRRCSALLVLTVVGIGSSAACSDGDTPEASGVGPRSDTETAVPVMLERSRFSPDELTVDPGVVVRFENLDAFDHTITASPDSALTFDSGDLDRGDVFEQRFDEPGTYDYFCEIHPTMRGTVTVT